MKKTLLWLLALLFLATIVGLVLLGAENLRGDHQATVNLFVAAFLGASCSFFFVRLGDALDRYYKRKQQHLNALVRFQHHLNYVLGCIDDNVYLASGFLQATSRPPTKGTNEVTIPGSGNRLSPIPDNRELILDLVNLDLINELFQLSISIRKCNSSIEAIERQYRSTLAFLGSQPPDFEGYSQSLKMTRANMSALREFMADAYAEGVEIFAKIRLLSKPGSILAWLFLKLEEVHYPKFFATQVEEEVERLRAEMDESREKSGRKIRIVEERLKNESREEG